MQQRAIISWLAFFLFFALLCSKIQFTRRFMAWLCFERIFNKENGIKITVISLFKIAIFRYGPAELVNAFNWTLAATFDSHLHFGRIYIFIGVGKVHYSKLEWASEFLKKLTLQTNWGALYMVVVNILIWCWATDFVDVNVNVFWSLRKRRIQAKHLKMSIFVLQTLPFS